MSLFRTVLLGASLFLPVLSSANAQPSRNTELDRLFDEMWRFRTYATPIKASYDGLTESNHLLPDKSPDALRSVNKKRLSYIETLESYLSDDDKRNSLPLTQQIDIEIRLHMLRDLVSKYKFKKHYIPLTAESGFHSRLGYIITFADMTTKEGIEAYLSRLSSVPKYFKQQMYWMNKGIEEGYTQPKVSMKGFESSIEAFITKDAQSNRFYAPFKRKPPTSISSKAWERYQAQAKQLIEEGVIPSYQRFYTFFIDTYYPNTRETLGISSIEFGKAYYADRVKHFTTTDLSGEDIHQIGLKEVARIRAEMEALIKEIGFEGTFAEFLTFLRTDPQFYPKTPDALLKEAAYIAKRIDGKLPSLFKTLPRRPYTVKPVPKEIAPKYTTGRYFSARKDNLPGEYWVNTYALDRRPLYELEALTLHEAVPGHHLQAAIAQEQKTMLPHRQTYYMSVFGEGWALYAEYLGIEAGFYQDPYSNFGRLTYEMWRACRLVVDTGIHLKGWSRQQAIDFMSQNTALSQHNIKTETDRYITWPAQALSYKMGELTIKQLRQKAEKALGPKFDIREFHDALLRNGSVTLKILEQIVDRYIEETLQAQAH